MSLTGISLASRNSLKDVIVDISMQPLNQIRDFIYLKTLLPVFKNQIVAKSMLSNLETDIKLTAGNSKHFIKDVVDTMLELLQQERSQEIQDILLSIDQRCPYLKDKFKEFMKATIWQNKVISNSVLGDPYEHMHQILKRKFNSTNLLDIFYRIFNNPQDQLKITEVFADTLKHLCGNAYMHLFNKSIAAILKETEAWAQTCQKGADKLLNVIKNGHFKPKYLELIDISESLKKLIIANVE